MEFEKGRLSEAARTVVRLVDGAVDDLETMLRKGDPQVVRWALKKLLLLERNPEAGEPLLGGLIGWRKIVVSDRHWRVVWRVGHDSSGAVVVDVAEVWAFGARSDSEVYAEVEARIAESDTPVAEPLVDVLHRLGKIGRGLTATPAPDPVVKMPDWLSDALVKVVGMRKEAVDELTPTEAEQIWETYTTTGQAPE
ncbi:type II toxin-antitoxin system RelE family toxin [Nocardioides limicola]|uniref:type II toxin-antitoxin system RelE family toxin n=1 Tax=Nocardioides limicola TaxID=2803368 RepID=UPI00193AF865|nr:hypothetical protein [Nocardioides sp. DJM-14]